MRRVMLVTDEMREVSAFYAQLRAIEAVSQQPRSKTATKKMIRALMTQLLESRSPRTVSYFWKIQERWGHLVDACKFLEYKLHLTFQDKLELIGYRFRQEPGIEELLEAVREVVHWQSTLGLKYRIRCLLTDITERCGDNSKLYRELLFLLSWYFDGCVNVFRVDKEMHERQRRGLDAKNGTHG